MLSYDDKARTFFLTSKDEASARNAGLTRSTRATGPEGEPLWYTAGYDKKPAYNPYAVLPFYEAADEKASRELAPYWRDYQASWAQDTLFEPPCPPDKEYRPFQKAGIEYATSRQHALIGDQPGLGKTAQAIGVANVYGATRVLIVCPASIRLAWQREIKQWSTLPRVTTYPILKSRDGVNPFVHYTIISYDLLRNVDIHAALHGLYWDLLVLDEVHYLKSMDAVRTRAVFGGGSDRHALHYLASKAEHILGLTGTPLPNRPRECYTVARALCWESIDWMSYEGFAYRYNPSGMTKTGHQLEMKGRLPELRARLRCNFMARRMKRHVLTDLPDEQYEAVHVEHNGDIKKVLRKENLLDFDPADILTGSFIIDGAVSTVRREMGEAMLPRIVDHTKYLLDIVGVDKVGVMCFHNSVMDMFIEKMHKYGVVCIRGKMSTNQKQQAVDTFIDDADTRIVLGQIDSITGVDGLQEVCSHVVVGEPSWISGNNEQAIDRFHRMGQHGNVVAQFLLVENSFNEKVLGTVLEKAHAINMALDGV